MATQAQPVTTTAVDVVAERSLTADENYTFQNVGEQEILMHVGATAPGDDGAWGVLHPPGSGDETHALVTIGDPIWVRVRARTGQLIIWES